MWSKATPVWQNCRPNIIIGSIGRTRSTSLTTLPYIKIIIIGNTVNFSLVRHYPKKQLGMTLLKLWTDIWKAIIYLGTLACNLHWWGKVYDSFDKMVFPFIKHVINPDIISTHCFQPLEGLVTKFFVKYCKIFSKLREAMKSDHLKLIMHTKFGGYPRVKCLHSFANNEKNNLLIYCWSNNVWCSASEADFSIHFNQLNLSNQEKQENI